MKRRVITISLLLTLLIGAACGGESDGGATEQGAGSGSDPVIVGLIFPLSGPSGPDGERVVEAVRVMAEIINDEGGVLGRNIEFVVKDDESTPAVGVARANELLQEDPQVVIEGWNSPVALAMQQVFAENDVLDITAVAKNDDIMSGDTNPYPIRLNSANAQDGEPIAELLVDVLGAKRIAFLPQNDAFGEQVVDRIIEAAREHDPEIEVVAKASYPLAESDFRTPLETVRAANPDAVVVVNSAQASGLPALISQYAESGINAPLLASTAGLPPATLEVAGDAAEGILSADTYHPGLPPFSEAERSVKYIERHRAETGDDPEPLPTMAAAALDVWAQAVERAGTFERVAVAEEIRGGTFDETILGSTSLDESGQREVEFILLRVEDGVLTLVEKKD